MLAERTPWCPLRRQQASDLFPVRWSYGWQPSNGKRIGEFERRIRQGGRSSLDRTPPTMRLPRLPLVCAAPPRPGQMPSPVGHIVQPRQMEPEGARWSQREQASAGVGPRGRGSPLCPPFWGGTAGRDQGGVGQHRPRDMAVPCLSETHRVLI